MIGWQILDVLNTGRDPFWGPNPIEDATEITLFSCCGLFAWRGWKNLIDDDRPIRGVGYLLGAWLSGVGFVFGLRFGW